MTKQEIVILVSLLTLIVFGVTVRPVALAKDDGLGRV